jgi:hypothetical protein
MPAFRKYRLESCLVEVIKSIADELLLGDAQELAGIDDRGPVATIIVAKQIGRGGTEQDRAEQLFKCFRAVFGEPESRYRSWSQ